MARLVYDGVEVDSRDGETVLEALERAGAVVPSSCRTGSCQTCLLQAVEGEVPRAAQVGLSPGMVARGGLLACRCLPSTDLMLGPADALSPSLAGTLRRIEAVGDGTVLRVWLTVPELDWLGGQYIHLQRADGLSRPYSIANLPGGDVELHVAIVPGGQMSGWLSEAASGTDIQVRGPAGECVYVSGEPDRPLVLAGLGTGLAPLLGVVRSALADGHTADKHLFVGARAASGLYLLDELQQLAADEDSVHLHLGALDAEGTEGVSEGKLEDHLLSQVQTLKPARWYVCGAAPWVRSLQRRLFLAGASLSRIHADAFTTRSD